MCPEFAGARPPDRNGRAHDDLLDAEMSVGGAHPTLTARRPDVGGLFPPYACILFDSAIPYFPLPHFPQRPATPRRSSALGRNGGMCYKGRRWPATGRHGVDAFAQTTAPTPPIGERTSWITGGLLTMNFGRVVRMAIRYKFTFAATIVSALMVAILWGVNIGAVYPVVEVVFKNKSMQQWVDEKITEHQAIVCRQVVRTRAVAAENWPPQSRAAIRRWRGKSSKQSTTRNTIAPRRTTACGER